MNTTTTPADVAVIGLAVMGANLSRNLASHGYTVAVYNRTTSVTTQFISEHGAEQFVAAESYSELVASLKRPRKLLLLVKSGDPVDAVLTELIPLLDSGDIVVDLGNSHYRDTIARHDRLAATGVHFLGSGLSGGEKGALEGPSLMPGGDVQAWEQIKEMFTAIAARDFKGGPCVTYIGPSGAGHYVKMVHNGIEYGIMQILAEVYNSLRTTYKLTAGEIAAVFSKLNQGSAASFLVEISAAMLETPDSESPSGFLIDVILDSATDKGTGRWTVQEAVEIGAAVPSVGAGVDARFISQNKSLRLELAKAFPSKLHQPQLALSEFTDQLEQALPALLLANFAQGFAMLSRARAEYNWSLDLAEIARIWQGGCIIRAEMLQTIEEVWRSEPELDHLFASAKLQPQLQLGMEAARTLLRDALSGGVPAPGSLSAVSYFDAMRTGNSPANFVQGLRNHFGAHGFQRIQP